ncbi:hypothetical protein SLA2020_470950 [Shorea laevis]
MAKPVILLMVALLLCSTLIYAARPEPAFSDDSPAKTHHEDDQAVEESCEEVGEEECLVRRSLAVHLDYVYTQKHNQP